MKDIKFKTYRKENLAGETTTLEALANGITFDISYDEYIWCLSTGILDKNGMLIHSGDIVKSRNGKISEVKFGEYCFTGGEYSVQGIGFYLYNEKDKGMFGIYDFPTKSEEIIGNIYQNPELVK